MSVVYSPLKMFAFVDRLRAGAGALAAPVHLRIKPINACNENCWYCAYRSDAVSLGNDMVVRDTIPRTKMLEIVDDAVAMGVAAVTFTGGGEPLIYPYLPETIRRLAMGDVRIGCLTNGVALRGDTADALANHATWVRVSIDGWDGESYAKSRGVPPAVFGRVIDNVARFAERRVPCALGMSFIVTRDNAEHIAEFCKLAKSIGVQHVKLSACVVANDARENNRYHEPIAGAVASEIERCRELEDERFSVLNHYHTLPERFERPYDRCPMLRLLTVIGADLGVYTCQDKAYTQLGKLGSIADRSFRQFWAAPETAAKVRAFNPQEACGHHCVSHQKNLLLTEFLALDPDHATFV